MTATRCCSRCLLLTLLLTLGVLARAASAQSRSPADANAAARTAGIEEKVRERLKREDETRPEHPIIVPLFGNPLFISGDYEMLLDALDPIAPEDSPHGDDEFLFAQELETEFLYVLSPSWSFFVQGRLVRTRDVLNEVQGQRHTELYLERGETWVAAEDLWGSGFSLDAGRLYFADDREWWWDENLDALLLSYERGPASAEVAVAKELFARSTNEDFPEPEDRERLRILGELSWDLTDDHELQFLFLYDDDRSGSHTLGNTVRTKREDDADARLFWLGPRAQGSFSIDRAGLDDVDYWADAALVQGDERLVGFRSRNGLSTVNSVEHQQVVAWGFDVGSTWTLKAPYEPRITLAYAMGSGDPQPDHGADTAFRQTGLQTNSTDLGGAQRLQYYGVLLDPELSNLGVATVGFGISLLESSSADLVYHHYRLIERSDSLSDDSLDAELNDADLDVGDEVDLILAIEEGDRFTLEVTGSAFRSGSAFGTHRNEWAFGGSLSFAVAF